MRIAVLILLLACAADAAAAQGRYDVNRVDAMPLCTWRAGGWLCRAAPDNRTARAKEIARLQDEVAALKRELAVARDLPLPPEASRRPSSLGEGSSSLPNHGALARTRDYLAQTWRRVVDMIVNIRKDVMGKG